MVTYPPSFFLDATGRSWSIVRTTGEVGDTPVSILIRTSLLMIEFFDHHALLTQLGECIPYKDEVTGPSPVQSTI